ncbi:hypothetical protein E3U43_004226 [Larimichthys crocea]|nr:hypothetical protein E3U43_004226 [Larimichthys crocea]
MLGPASSLTQAYRNTACNIQRNKGFLYHAEALGPAGGELGPPTGTPSTKRPVSFVSSSAGKRQARDARSHKMCPNFEKDERQTRTDDRAKHATLTGNATCVPFLLLCVCMCA